MIRSRKEDFILSDCLFNNDHIDPVKTKITRSRLKTKKYQVQKYKSDIIPKISNITELETNNNLPLASAHEMANNITIRPT